MYVFLEKVIVVVQRQQRLDCNSGFHSELDILGTQKNKMSHSGIVRRDSAAPHDTTGILIFESLKEAYPFVKASLTQKGG